MSQLSRNRAVQLVAVQASISNKSFHISTFPIQQQTSKWTKYWQPSQSRQLSQLCWNRAIQIQAGYIPISSKCKYQSISKQATSTSKRLETRLTNHATPSTEPIRSESCRAESFRIITCLNETSTKIIIGKTKPFAYKVVNAVNWANWVGIVPSR